MNKKFLQQLNERRDLFKVLDLSDEDKKHNETEEEEADEEEASDEELIPKSKYSAREFTKYLQYITASD